MSSEVIFVQLTAKTEIEDHDGKPELALNVFAEILKEMRKSFRDLYDKQFAG